MDMDSNGKYIDFENTNSQLDIGIDPHDTRMSMFFWNASET